MNKAALLHAIDLALHGSWNEAHHDVQEYADEFACWIHVVLHKIEGDESNSRYWYRKAGKEFTNISPETELTLIKNELQED